MKRWILKVERQHRLRLSSEIVESVPWLTGAEGQVIATAHIGEKGQVCVLPPGSGHQQRHDRLKKHLSKNDGYEGRSIEALALGRYIADAVSLTFSKERNRITVVLPEEMRALKCSSKKGELAVVVVLYGTLEIWRADDWRDHLMFIHANLEKLAEDSAEELGMENEDG